VAAAAFRVTVQESVPAPVIDPLTQLSEDRFDVFVTVADVPVPLDPSGPELAAFTISLPPVQPDRANGRKDERRRRRNTCQRRDVMICPKRALHRRQATLAAVSLQNGAVIFRMALEHG